MLPQSIHYAKKGVFTVLTLFLSIYVFTILLTYTPNDPSWSQIGSSIDHISNMGGAVGAWLSDLLYTFFGAPAWLFILFFGFEAAMLWREHNLPELGLRLVAYVFLLLATSALCSAVGVFFALDAQGVWSAQVGQQALSYGGIVGFEVLRRLSNLLTTSGAFIFLLVFSFITATFAFDLRFGKYWQVFMQRIKQRKVTSNDDLGLADDWRDDSSVDRSTKQSHMLGVTEDGEQIDAHGQLALTLPPQQKGMHREDTQSSSVGNIRAQVAMQNAKMGNLFSDFLQNSGLSDALLELQAEEMEAEQERLSASSESKKQPRASMFAKSSAYQSNSDRSHSKKLGKQSNNQPSKFAKNDNEVSAQVEHLWEDQSIIDALLDEQNQQINEQVELTDSNPSTSSQSTPSQSESSQSTPSQSMDMTPTNTPPANPKEAIDGDSDSSQFTKLNNLNKSDESDETDDLIDADISTDKGANDDTDDILKAFRALGTLGETSAVDDTNDVPINADAKPQPNANTNTNTNTKTNTKPKTTQTRTEPNIKFDVADGERSNTIEEMMPESDHSSDEARLNKVMPPIEDDDAFKTKSRAMQTAKHRNSLTPIPSISILDKPDPDLKPSYSQQELEQLSELLEIKLQDFNVKAEVVNAIPGPVVTRFEVELAPGIKASKVTGISRDLARSLSMASLRVVEVIPGKPYIGIEVPNKKRQMVRLIELLTTDKYNDPNAQISMAMGKDIGGKPIITDLARAPHMLVAGTTGSGKSVLVNSMLLSMLLKYKPDELRLILIDPKQLELANYNEIPHLLTPVVTDMNEAASSLSWCVAEMERRYQLMSLLKVRKLNEFNKKVIKAEQAGKPMIDPLWHPNDSVSIDHAPKLKTLPMIVIVADEFADMIMQVGKQAEELITRLAQKSRAAGIHLMLATQRPSVDVITGLIKANIPVRAALRVNSKVDSRTILDSGGAEDMLGNGDMLFLGPGQIEPDRVHGAYVSDEEVNRVCDAWRERGAPDYIDNMASNFELTSPSGGGNTSGEDDQLYDEAVAFVMETRKVSASSIQRKFSIGYNRAARIVDSMEEAGLVSPMGKSGKRELLM